ncbi:MAG: AI-2E family transporter YdiK [Betaproteobacteria bacterium]|nr:AI-2E family transporter YdiK [Betaproteobacteria bacterium]
MSEPIQRDLTRNVLAILVIGGLCGFSFWILRPFLPAIIWATMIVVATWPLMTAIQNRLWGKRWLAVSIMTVLLLLVFVVPFSLAIGTIVENSDRIAGWVKSIATLKMPPPSEMLHKIPMVGERIIALWNDVIAAGPSELASKAAPYAGKIASWFVAEVGSFGLVAAQFVLTIIISTVLYSSGESAATLIRQFARRLGGERGDDAVKLAGQAIRGVALGVVVTALAQSLLGGIGLAVAGIPFATVLTAVMFMLALAQIGAAPVLFVAVVWLYWSGAFGWATALLVWAIIVGSLDNVLRPILIKKGGDLPLLLIFAGVIGGLVAFGLVGIFVGPVVLAVTYTLFAAWAAEGSNKN